MIEYQIALKTFVEGPPFVAGGVVNFKDIGEMNFMFKQTHDNISITVTGPKESYYNCVALITPAPIDKQQAEHLLKYLLITYAKSLYGTERPGAGG